MKVKNSSRIIHRKANHHYVSLKIIIQKTLLIKHLSKAQNTALASGITPQLSNVKELNTVEIGNWCHFIDKDSLKLRIIEKKCYYISYQSTSMNKTTGSKTGFYNWQKHTTGEFDQAQSEPSVIPRIKLRSRYYRRLSC